ncbi:MAG: hypothetical protein K2K00_00570, partial [Muribaculaceae bacterium]|nr:hypothetical protein [Muribaculaceae bacterium]
YNTGKYDFNRFVANTGVFFDRYDNLVYSTCSKNTLCKMILMDIAYKMEDFIGICKNLTSVSMVTSQKRIKFVII